MSFHISKRSVLLWTAAAFLALCACAASAITVDELYGNFAQRRSGVCVIYAHVMVMAEYDPDTFTKLVTPTFGGWIVRFSDNRRMYVTREEVEKSIANGYSYGDADNLLTIYSIALTHRTGSFKKDTGELTYGDLDFVKFLGTGKWTLYDDTQTEPGRTLADGLKRLIRETLPDGRTKVPCTVGFGGLDKKSIPEAYAEEASKRKLIGGHDFSVSKCDVNKKVVYLRNPHNPKELLEVPIDFLAKIPCGIDFMEK